MMGTFLPVADADDVGAAADVELIQRVHRRDPAASAELWRRHYRHALAATEAIGDTEDPSLVADAFHRVEEGIVRGERPRGAFRAHLLTQVRAIAVAAGSASGARARVAPRDRAAADAYGELFSDQQELLWYSEIEGMTPDAIAPLVHAAPTAVTKLTAGARRELRRIWLKTRPAEPDTAAECAWTRTQLPALAEASLTTADAERAQEHLAECRACAALATEVDRLPSRLAAGVLPGVLGAAGAAAYRTTVLDTGVRTADIPPVPRAEPAPGATAAADSAVIASATVASPAPGDIFDAGTPAEVAARALAAPAALTPAGRAAGRAASTRRPRAGRRAFSGVAITAVLVTGAVVATGAVAVSVLPTLGTQETTRTIDADTRLTASETTPTPRPTRSATTAPNTTEDPPAPLLPEAAPPTSGSTDRVGTAPRATTPRTPTAPFALRDAFQTPAPSPSAPTPAPVRPTTPTTPATPTTPTDPTAPTTPTTPDPVRPTPTPTPDPVQPTDPPTDPEPTTPPVTTPPTNPPTTPPLDPEPEPQPEPQPDPEPAPQPEPTSPIADLLDQLFTPPPAAP
jgi:DNA-directed RNA polymerase specialized sigma24 family protein